jgi:hypothetical protein
MTWIDRYKFHIDVRDQGFDQAVAPKPGDPIVVLGKKPFYYITKILPLDLVTRHRKYVIDYLVRNLQFPNEKWVPSAEEIEIGNALDAQVPCPEALDDPAVTAVSVMPPRKYFDSVDNVFVMWTTDAKTAEKYGFSEAVVVENWMLESLDDLEDAEEKT